MRNRDGTFGVGNPGGGRPKGSRNKTTNDLKNFFNDFLHKHIEELDSAFADLEPREKFKVILDMSKYVIPTLKAQGDLLDEITDEQFEELIDRLKNELELT